MVTRFELAERYQYVDCPDVVFTCVRISVTGGGYLRPDNTNYYPEYSLGNDNKWEKV